MTMTQSNPTSAPTHTAYLVREGQQKAYWKKIGAAWAHKDGKGFSLHLEAMPLDGRISLRANMPAQ